MNQSKKNIQYPLKRVVFLFVFTAVLFNYGSAQRPKAGGGGKRPANVNKPANVRKPANVSRPANVSKSANAGRSNNVSRPSSIGGNDRKPERNNGDRNNVSNAGNRNIKAGNKTNVGNKINIDNSRKNVNINVDNSKNVRVNNNRYTSVRRSPNYRPYARPPYRYGGYRYNCYRPYYYHPYRPFVWGPRWHPWGFFVATLAATAIILTVDNDMPGDLDLAYNTVFDNSYYPVEKQLALPGASFTSYPGNQKYNNNQTENAVLTIQDQYYYDEGVYYLKGDEGFTVVAAPLGATIKTLPTGFETITLDDNTKNYYYGGTFYEKSSKGYTVVAPTAGSVVMNVSDGGEDVKIGEVTYVKLGDTYFQPIQQDGKDAYEVADVEEDK